MNREQKKVLTALNTIRLSGRPFSATELHNLTKIYDRYKMVKLCDSLKKSGYLDALSVNQQKEITVVCLSYRGITFRQEARKEFLHYVSDKWIDFLALLSSIAALVISLIALLSQ